MEPRPVETIRLQNGLNLEICDLSRKVAADRWRVELLAGITIPVEQRWFGSAIPGPSSIETLRASLGETVRFEYRAQRNFIDERDKAPIFESMHAAVKQNAQRYYGRPDFPARYLIKQYRTLSRIRPPKA